jgi:hypothetical protein
VGFAPLSFRKEYFDAAQQPQRKEALAQAASGLVCCLKVSLRALEDLDFMNQFCGVL